MATTTTTTPTKPSFPRFDIPFDSRSPSRSPRRKAQFAIRELDPLLANLSPDSTLRALQATQTIPGGTATQDALTNSIIDATPAEREIGIRAAFVAQKLREWLDELSKWKWPNPRDRTFGLGFLPPSHPSNASTVYTGSLTQEQVDQYEARLDEIRDDLDSLEIDDIKDHVLAAHVPAKKPEAVTKPSAARKSYGRMRDFTALITATVIQALPDLAKLNMLVDEWDVRLRILRGLPKFRSLLVSVQEDIGISFREIRNSDQAASITDELVDKKKSILGEQVSDLGRRADRFLDILEGHEDALPQVWIDTLEKIELDYATWVVEAQHVALRNKLSTKTSPSPSPTSLPVNNQAELDNARSGETPSVQPTEPSSRNKTEASINISSSANKSTDLPQDQTSKVRHKPSLTIAMPETKGHKREISKISIADSTFSVASDISNAEIVDVTRTSVLPSPRVNVVDNPFKVSNEDLNWFGPKAAVRSQNNQKPPMLQRASTTSIEVVPSHQLKRVMLTRSASWDMLAHMPESPAPSTPSKALQQLTGKSSPGPRTPVAELEDPSTLLGNANASVEPTPLPSPAPSLMVEPLRVRTRSEELGIPPIPALPRRSSKRHAVSSFLDTSSPLTPISSASPITPVGSNNSMKSSKDKSLASVSESPISSKPNVLSSTPKHKKQASLDDKIQDLLTSLPTKIRLAKDRDSPPSPSASTASTRSSTPTPGLTLSAVKSESSSRKSSVGDSEIRLYHLTRAGQARDTPPVKLFVRTVGDGNRVMVRVGGGWADLGEYLKEYSLHHGSRTTGDGRLEVASFPVNNHRDSLTSPGVATNRPRRKSASPSILQNGFDGQSQGELVNNKLRTSSSKSRLPDQDGHNNTRNSVSTPPPVPTIPATFTTKSPTMTTVSDSNGMVSTSAIDPDTGLSPSRLPGSLGDPFLPSTTRLSTITSPGVTTTTVVSPPVTTSTSYTPLGAAGPKVNKRASTIGTLPTTSNDAWVEGIVGKARAVSGGTSTLSSNPMTTTTTTKTTVVSTPHVRRASYWGMGSSPASNTTSPQQNSSPSASSGTVSPSASLGSVEPKSRRLSLMGASKNRMSLGDIGGIKRVFLRKKLGEVK